MRKVGFAAPSLARRTFGGDALFRLGVGGQVRTHELDQALLVELVHLESGLRLPHKVHVRVTLVLHQKLLALALSLALRQNLLDALAESKNVSGARRDTGGKNHSITERKVRGPNASAGRIVP